MSPFSTYSNQDDYQSALDRRERTHVEHAGIALFGGGACAIVVYIILALATLAFGPGCEERPTSSPAAIDPSAVEQANCSSEPVEISETWSTPCVGGVEVARLELIVQCSGTPRHLLPSPAFLYTYTVDGCAVCQIPINEGFADEVTQISPSQWLFRWDIPNNVPCSSTFRHRYLVEFEWECAGQSGVWQLWDEECHNVVLTYNGCSGGGSGGGGEFEELTGGGHSINCPRYYGNEYPCVCGRGMGTKNYSTTAWSEWAISDLLILP